MQLPHQLFSCLRFAVVRQRVDVPKSRAGVRLDRHQGRNRPEPGEVATMLADGPVLDLHRNDSGVRITQIKGGARTATQQPSFGQVQPPSGARTGRSTSVVRLGRWPYGAGPITR